MQNQYTLSEVTADSHLSSKQNTLVHAVTAHGEAACGKVKSENLCGYSDALVPTCKKCFKLFTR